MLNHEVGHCDSVDDLLDGIATLCERHNVTGIAVVLSIQSGECMTTHQFGLDDSELAVASQLLADYSKWLVIDHIEN